MKCLIIVLLCFSLAGCTAQQVRYIQAFCDGYGGYRQPCYRQPVYVNDNSDVVRELRRQESNRRFERIMDTKF